MSDSNISVALAYYKAFENKDVESITNILHPDIEFITPMGNSRGSASVIEAAKRLLPLIKSIDVRAKFSSADQVMLVYDLNLTAPVDRCPSAVLMTIRENLIVRTELFYDARPFGNL